MAGKRCGLTAVEPKHRAGEQCEYSEDTGYGPMEIGKPVPAFQWALCAGHTALLREEVRLVIREDMQKRADAMGLRLRDD